ncbi:MAG: hypothetical protein D3M94_19035 [Rhodocyclales bacterium GT-UBC]|nr:MAG: hypothetical protein D3M94_19035 [Rhodocyclales bacterium GT-UBC]
MPNNTLPADSFGDPFSLPDLPLPRQAVGFAVQRLDCDTLLDKTTGQFLPIRACERHVLFGSFDEAFAAASAWVLEHSPPPADHCLAIVPAGFDETMNRPYLIYGVLCTQP